MIKGDHPTLKAATIREDMISGLALSATTLAFGGAEMPADLDGRDLFAPAHKPRHHLISARDRCDYTIDRIRTDKLRYIRNSFPDRPMLQAQYRDERPPVLELKKLRKKGKLTPYQEAPWFGKRPTAELYDLPADPYQIENLAADPKYRPELKRHRKILENWIKETRDKGQTPEEPRQLKATYDLWKNKPIFKRHQGESGIRSIQKVSHFARGYSFPKPKNASHQQSSPYRSKRPRRRPHRSTVDILSL